MTSRVARTSTVPQSSRSKRTAGPPALQCQSKPRLHGTNHRLRACIRADMRLTLPVQTEVRQGAPELKLTQKRFETKDGFA